MEQRLLVLPGTSSPEAGRHKECYAAILREAEDAGYRCHLATYPGQIGSDSGRVSYESAVQCAVDVCRSFRPSRVIARSFGCSVAVGLIACEGTTCPEAVLWGPFLRKKMDRKWPTAERRIAEIERFAAGGTFLSPDYFESIEPIEELVERVACNIRIAAGSLDEYCSRADLEQLATVHKRGQAGYRTDLRFIDGLPHTVVRAHTPAKLYRAYVSCLFDPV